MIEPVSFSLNVSMIQREDLKVSDAYGQSLGAKGHQRQFNLKPFHSRTSQTRNSIQSMNEQQTYNTAAALPQIFDSKDKSRFQVKTFNSSTLSEDMPYGGKSFRPEAVVTRTVDSQSSEERNNSLKTILSPPLTQ